jgi:hypothetical protein
MRRNLSGRFLGDHGARDCGKSRQALATWEHAVLGKVNISWRSGVAVGQRLSCVIRATLFVVGGCIRRATPPPKIVGNRSEEKKSEAKSESDSQAQLFGLG